MGGAPEDEPIGRWERGITARVTGGERGGRDAFSDLAVLRDSRGPLLILGARILSTTLTTPGDGRGGGVGALFFQACQLFLR